jgi:hypothetical protein
VVCRGRLESSGRHLVLFERGGFALPFLVKCQFLDLRAKYTKIFYSKLRHRQAASGLRS